MSASEPAETIAHAQRTSLRARSERDDVAGFAVVGQPFASGDLLCLRCFPASSFGPGYVSVWHRAKDEQWTVYTTVAPDRSCPRFIGSAVSRVFETPIELQWGGQFDLTVRVPAARLIWNLHLANTRVTRLMNLTMAWMPAALFDSKFVLSAMSLFSTRMLAAGQLQLGGHVPNRQWFKAAPRKVWVVSSATASLGGNDFGPQRALPTQAFLGKVPLPQRGIVMLGTFSFEAYTPERHLPARPLSQ